MTCFLASAGFSLGLERTGGFETVAFCEIEEFPRRVLAKHWPKVPCYHDIRDLTAEQLAADGIAVDAICGGFPCQDISLAGHGAGLEGKRSGLWREFRRLICELRPRVVFVENVPAIVHRGLGRVIGDLAELRYAAEWHCISAASVGARHFRNRMWIVADADEGALRPQWFSWLQNSTAPVGPRLVSARGSRRAYDVPNWLDRVGACGNAVVPQIPELIGRAWLEAVRESEAA